MPAQEPSEFRKSPISNVLSLAAAVVITAVAATAWLPMVMGLTSLIGSDAAGNGLAQAYTAIAMGLVWILLAVLALIAWSKGDMPLPLALAALIFIPVSCMGAFTALDLLSDPHKPPYLWPIVLPATVPPFIILFCFWALAPSLRRAIPPAIMGGAVFGVAFVLCASLYPMGKIREAVNEQEAAELQRYEDEFAALKADAPLWEWTRFLDTRNEVQRGKVIDGIRALDRRQSEAETMLERGDFPLGYLARFDLDPTPAVCDKARAQLRKQAAALTLKKPTKRYVEVFGQVQDALSALRWLIGYGCDSDAEVTAWEKTANSYIEPGFDTVELRELHDPKKLGQVLRESPERFSMLTPQSHLSAWLKFTEDDKLREQALAGARKLASRTGDAEEILGNEYTSFQLMKYLTVLDLETTPKLCSRAGKLIRARFAMVYRPKPEDRMPYKEFLDRVGELSPLDDLLWLAGQGCDMDPLLTETESLIGAYQDTPGRAAMLAKLASLHKKP